MCAFHSLAIGSPASLETVYHILGSLVSRDRPYDAPETRLRIADTIVFLDFSIARCVWRAIRRSRERADFWLWLLRYRRLSRPILMEAIARHATGSDLRILRNPAEVREFLKRTAELLKIESRPSGRLIPHVHHPPSIL